MAAAIPALQPPKTVPRGDGLSFPRRRQGEPLRAHRERARRYRGRQKSGQLVITLAVTPSETHKLFCLGYLSECALEDRDQIARAVHDLIANIVTE